MNGVNEAATEASLAAAKGYGPLLHNVDFVKVSNEVGSHWTSTGESIFSQGHRCRSQARDEGRSSGFKRVKFLCDTH